MTDHIRVRYRVEPADGRSLLEVGRKIAQEQSLGGYEWEFHRDFDVSDYGATLYDAEGDHVVVDYPTGNVAPTLSHLLNYVAGDAFGGSYVDAIKISDVTLPASFVDAFPGPQFGVDGVRERAGVEARRPLLGMILKPSLGLTPDRIGDLVRTAADAGVDVIKEDEKLVDPEYCRFEDRLDEVVEALEWMRRETDTDALYALNVTGRADAFLRYVEERGLGTVGDRFAFLDTFISDGFGSLQRLAEDDRFDGPVYAHRGGHAAYTRTDHGISMRVLEKLTRLAGADVAHCGAVVGSHERKRQEVLRNKRALVDRTGPWAGVEPCLPVVSGGVNPGNVMENLDGVTRPGAERERDVAFVIGSGIFAHSGGTLDGIAAGVRANRQAIEAAMEGLDADDVTRSTADEYDDMRAWLRTAEE